MQIGDNRIDGMETGSAIIRAVSMQIIFQYDWNLVAIFGTKYSRMDQVKFVEDSL